MVGLSVVDRITYRGAVLDMAGLILPWGFQNGTERPRVQFDNLEELRAATKLPGFHEKGSLQNHVCGLLHIPSS